MRKLKLTLGLLTLVFGMTIAFAFTSGKTNPVTLNEKWYEFVGDDENDMNDYVLVGGTGTSPASCDEGIDVTCSIHAVPSSTPGKPNLSTLIEEDTIYRPE